MRATGVAGEGAHRKNRRGTLGSSNDGVQEGILYTKSPVETITLAMSNWMAEQFVVAMKWGNAHGAKELYLDYIFNKVRRIAWTQKFPLRKVC